METRKMTRFEREAVERRIQESLDGRGIKPGSKRAMEIEADMLVGAMLTLEAMFPNEDRTKISEAIPPIWVIARMSGRSMLKGKR